MLNIFIGCVIGLVFGILLIKRQIKRDGAGQLKCCQNCPYFIRKPPDDDFINEVSDSDRD